MRSESLVGVQILAVWLLASGGLRVSLRNHAGFGRPPAISPRKDTLCGRKTYAPTGHGLGDCGPMSGLPGRLRFPDWLDASMRADGSPITEPCDAFLIVTIHLYYSGGSRLAGKTIARALYV